MSNISLDPEDALDMLGLDEAAHKPPQPDVLDVEFPPLNSVKPGAQPSAAASAAGASGRTDPEIKVRLATANKAKEKSEAEKDRMEKQLRTAQDAERRALERVKKLEEDLVAARAAKGMGGGDAVRERDALRVELDALKLSLQARGRMSGLPINDEDGPLSKEGLLEQTPYGRILVKALRDRFTGRLALKTGNARREVYFDEGAPVAYSSSEPGERLGRVLVTQGRITEEQYLAAARAMVERGAKLTEALLEQGAIDADRLGQEQRQLTRDQIISGFALTQGTYTLEEGKAAPEEVGRFEFRAGEIYLQGYRKYTPESEVKAMYAAVKDAYVRTRAEFTAFKPALGLEPEDERVLKLLGEAYTVEEAVERSSVPQERGARLLGALKLLGLVSEWKPGVGEFEARLKAEKLRQAEEALTLKQGLQEREEQLFSELQKTMSRIEQGIKDVHKAVASGVVVQSAASSAGHGSYSEAPASTKNMVAKREFAPTTNSGSPPPTAPPPAAHAPPPPSAALAPTLSVQPLPDPPKATAAVDPAEDGPGHDRYKEGMRQAAAGRLDEAETALRESVRLDATRPAYLTALARVLLANPRYERGGTLPVVRSLLDRAQQLAPGDTEVAALLARIQQEMA